MSMGGYLPLVQRICVFIFLLFLSVGICIAVYKVYKITYARLKVTRVIYSESGAQEGRNESRTTCLVCLDDYAQGDIIDLLECEHAFHTKCIQLVKDHKPPEAGEQLAAVSCPICRVAVRVE